MSLEDYRKALRLGQKEVKAALARGESGEMEVLPSEREEKAARRERLGLVEIPIHLIAGTYTQLRQDAFSPGFYPLINEGSEFAAKWSALCDAHLEEGIRDPIKAVEYLNRYYVIEGHKRVSVLKYFGAISVPGMVTRLIPQPSEDPEVQAYYEFLDFYRMTGLNFVVFRRPGEYQELMEAMGRSSKDPWSAEELYQFRYFFSMFRDAYGRFGGSARTVAPAFLIYAKIFGYRESRGKLSTQILEDLPKIRQEIQNRLENSGIALVLEDNAKKPLLFLSGGGKVKAAFIHGGNAAASKWVYSHEYGRYSMETAMRGQVETMSYEDVLTDEACQEAVADAVENGANVIFTTTPKLLQVSVKMAVLHPDVKILNCSLNTAYPSVRTYYPRLYEAKFIKGAIAGTLTPDGRIGYVADYPTYGSIAGINAFTQGARMVNANARVYLEWSQLEKGNGLDRLQAAGIIYIDNLDRLTANTGAQIPGMHNLAMILCRWGRLYQGLIKRVMEGTWKNDAQGSRAVNYWWGMKQGVADVLCSRSLPVGTRRLVSTLRDALQSERLDPFYGQILDQHGQVARQDEGPLPADRILTMNWLSEYVVGRIPDFEELTDRAKELVKLQGVERQT